eukprot:gnl/Hemi2/18063_TR5971_c0_g1_i2.p1 gnl/Hemi2/18063_TR5971_c0_g1~~gnl/Hemi2/18063_TR5971_c0_g1_i2.p1  ORF type:complete len:256 (+),score=90.42 gnl/Hemi2/18063_TR5971_c0_g1_i2:109-876(+)
MSRRNLLVQGPERDARYPVRSLDDFNHLLGVKLVAVAPAESAPTSPWSRTLRAKKPRDPFAPKRKPPAPIPEPAVGKQLSAVLKSLQRPGAKPNSVLARNGTNATQPGDEASAATATATTAAPTVPKKKKKKKRQKKAKPETVSELGVEYCGMFVYTGLRWQLEQLQEQSQPPPVEARRELRGVETVAEQVRSLEEKIVELISTPVADIQRSAAQHVVNTHMRAMRQQKAERKRLAAKRKRLAKTLAAANLSVAA